ncbi:MAG: porin [Pseudomonadota bacterium]|nr:porin [Pseudomonadota bacterium]
MTDLPGGKDRAQSDVGKDRWEQIEEAASMNKLVSVAVRTALASALGLALLPSPALASGFGVPELSAAGIGTSNALVANPEEPGAFAYNPAAMGFHDRSSLAVGALFIDPKFSVKTATGNHDSKGADWAVAPMIQGAAKVNEQWWFGFGINAPFGLETRWKEGTFPKLSGTELVPTGFPPPLPSAVAVPRGFHPTESQLQTLALVPTVTYRVNDNLSVAAGADYYIAKTARLNTQLTDLSGDGDGWGWNLSALYANGPWSVGASYHSAATLGIDGTFFTAFPKPLLLDANVDMDLPWRLQLGARYAFNEQLAFEFDWTRTGWSEFDELEIKSQATGAVIANNINKWDDANAYRFGLTYDVLPQTQLRFGYSYDETGQGDEFFSARIADSDRQLFSIGVAQNLGQGWALEAGYMYVLFKDRDFRGSKPYTPVVDLGEEVNGTDAVNGDYEAYAHLFGLEVRRTF